LRGTFASLSIDSAEPIPIGFLVQFTLSKANVLRMILRLGSGQAFQVDCVVAGCLAMTPALMHPAHP
jgi:hypothetical protein